MAGFPLKLGGVVCVGALACGPTVGDSSGSASGSGSGNASGSSTGTGFDLTTMGSQTVGPSTSTSPTEGDSSSGSATGETTGPNPLDCSYRGDICGEFLVCQCYCDYSSDCCGCETAECTENAHCAMDQVCLDAGAYSTYIELSCVPGLCAGSSMRNATVQTLRDAMYYEDDVCLSALSISGPGLVDLAPLTNLEYIHSELLIYDNEGLVVLDGLENLGEVGTLNVVENPVLTSVAGLAGLQKIRDGGSIRNNPALPAAEVNALLAGIEGGDTVQVCGNLDDVGC